MARLGDYIEQIRGVSYKPEDICASTDSDAVAILRANNIQDDGLNFDDLVCVKKSKVSEKQYIQKGDIVVCASSGSKNLVGKAVIANEDMEISFGAFCKVVRPKKLMPSYVGHYFQSPKYRNKISELAGGANINNIRNEHIDELDIVIPIIDEQERISIELNKVGGLISLRKQQLSKLDELVKSRFIELFGDPITNPMGWELHRFDSLCENLDSRRKPITASERQAGIYPYYGASGIVDYVADYIFDEDILLVSEDGANLLMRSTPIAFSVSGKVWINNHAHVVRFEKMSMQKYIEAFFSLIDVSDHITGSAQPKLNQAKLNAMMFPVPSDDRLEAFLQFVEQTDKSKFEIQKSLEKLETLKKSLMQKYFG